MRKYLLFLLLFPSLAMAQTATSTVAGGPWDQTTTWVGGVVPNSSFGTITIVGPVNVSPTFYNSVTPLLIDQTTVNTGGTLTIDAGAQVNINAGAGVDLTVAGTGQIQVNGTLVQTNATAFTTTAANTFFNAGSTYEHQNTAWGNLLSATWDPASTILVTGITGTGNAGVTWSQSIGNFTFDCANLAAGSTANLLGRITTIAGNLTVNQTGASTGIFSLSSNQTASISVGGSVNVFNNSNLRITTSGNITLTVGGNFNFASTSATASQNATTGTGIVQLNGGDFVISSGIWNFVSGAGTGTIILNGGNFLASGAIVERTGAGNANINFIGAAANQAIDLSPTLIAAGAINLTVGKTSGNVNLQSPLTINSFTQTGGSLVQNGLALTINGIINQTGGNIDASTNTSFIVGGTGTISAGLVFSPVPSMFDVFTLNRPGVTLSTASDFNITALNLTAGTLTNSGVLTMEDLGSINVVAGVLTNVPAAVGVYDVSYANTGALSNGVELPIAPSTVLRHLSKSAAGTFTLLNNVNVGGNLTLSGGTFAAGANAISLTGNFVSNAALTTAAGSSFTFAGPTSTLSGATAPTFIDLIVNGTLTPSLSYRVNGNYTVGPGATVNAGSGTVTFGGTTIVTNNGTMNLNAVTINNTFTMTAPATTMGIAGNFTSTGTFNHGGGTILFNGTTNLSAAEVYNNITVTGVVTCTGNFSQTVAGSMINNGSFNISSIATGGNLTWSGSGTLSGTGNTTVADVNVTGTSFTYTSSGNLTLNDDILGAGSFDSSGSSGSVIFAGAGAAIGAGGTRTFRNISVTGTLTPGTTYTLTGAGGLDVSGTLVNGGTIVFGGTTQTITGTSLNIAFNVFTTNAGSTLTISPDITINGNLTGNGDITSAGTITFVGLTMSGTGAKSFNHVVVGTGTLTPNASYSIAGNLTVNGTLAGGNATTTFNGTTAISGAGATTFNFLTITGSLTSSAGTISVVRDFTNNGTFNHNGGIVSFSTAGTNQIQILGSNSIVFNDVIINNVGVATDVFNNVTAPATVDIAGSLSFGEANAVLDADGAGSSVLRFLSTNDNLASDGRVAPITFAGCNILGNFTVQRYVSQEGATPSAQRFYRYIASPVVGATVAQLQNSGLPVTGVFLDPSTCTNCISTSPSLFSFEETREPPYTTTTTTKRAYEAFPTSSQSSAAVLANGDGYAAFFRQDLTGPLVLSFVGTYRSTGTINLPVAPTTTAGDGGFSLVGNPYPSPIVWGATGWTRTGIGDVIVVRDNATGVHQSHGTADNFIIAPGQSFWVQSTSAGASLQITETAKSTAGTYQFYKVEQPVVDQLELQLTKGSTGVTDNARVVLTTGSSLAYDNFDGYKFDNSKDDGTTVTQVQDISTLSSDAKALAFNAIPAVSCGQVFNLKVTNFVNTGETIVNYSLSVNPSGALKSISWMLHDNYIGLDVDLSINPTYNFTVDNSIAASKASNRFTLTATSAPAIDISKSITSSSTVCSGTDAVLNVSSQNGFTYGAEINGVYYPNVEQGNGYNIPVVIDNAKLVDGANTIRLKANSGCDQQFLTTSVVVNKLTPYQISSSSGATICKPGSVVLNASASQPDAAFNWYETGSSPTVVGTGNQFTTPVLTDSTTYYVAAVSPSGCEGDRVPVAVTFSNLSKAVSVVQTDAICKGGSTTLSATSTETGGSFNWYDSVDGVTSLSTMPDFTTGSLQSSKKYYVSYSLNGCESERVEAMATVMDFQPTLKAVTNNPVVCSGSNHLLTASGAPAGSTYQWFDSVDGTTPLGEGATYETSSLTSTATYYLESRNEAGCVSARTSVTAAVDGATMVPNFTYTSDKVCRNGSSLVKITNNNPDVVKFRWYTDAVSDNLLHEGLDYTTETIGDNAIYYVSGVNSHGCESKVRDAVNVVVIKFNDPVIDKSVEGVLKSNFAQGNQWFRDNELLLGETNQILSTTFPGTYDLRVTYQGCVEWAGAVGLNNLVTGLEDEEKEINIYPNPTSDLLKIQVKEVGKVSVSLLDERGSEITQIPVVEKGDGWYGEVSVNSLSKGLYFLRIFSGSKSLTHKVIIK